MTSLLPPRTTRRPGPESGPGVGPDLATRRPLVLLATAGGAVSAASTLLVCLAVGVVGWYLTDSGAHGAPRDGLRTGALGWLSAHGSGVRVEGVLITAVPLGLTLLCAWAIWRVGHRVGVSVSGHGPDADAIGDGQRDWTVPVAATLFTAGYVVVAVLTTRLAATEATAPSAPRVVLWSVLLCVLLGATSIAVGAGRAAIWASYLPETVRVAAHLARRMLVLWLVLATLAFAVSLATDLDTAANVMSQLGADTGAGVLIVGLSLLVLPNAVAFSSSFLMGPGFTVGAGTLVAPSAVVLGPLPAFPMLAALPADGSTASWTAWLVALPPLVAVVATVTCLTRFPTDRLEEGAMRGLAGGVLAGLAVGVLSGLAGGAVGPGRLRDVGPFGLEVLLHAVTAFGIAGLLTGLAVTWWQRRGMDVRVTLDDDDA